jgi:hypothetical protein
VKLTTVFIVFITSVWFILKKNSRDALWEYFIDDIFVICFKKTDGLCPGTDCEQNVV